LIYIGNTSQQLEKVRDITGHVDEEFLQMGNYIDDVDVLNRYLTDWLVEYNFNRPHQSLEYATPIEFLTKKLGSFVFSVE